ncbi:MAG TPA: carbohydrate kinase family protein [Clostridiaceae bacterium]
MLDIVGIGALNVDFTATAEKMNKLPADMVKEAMSSFIYGAERLVDKNEIERIMTLLRRDSFRNTLGGSAFNTISAMAALGSGIRIGFSGMAGTTGSKNLSFKGAMDEMSVDNTYLGCCEAESSGLCISINQAGVRSFIHYPGCNSRMADFLRANYEDILQYLVEARMLHVTQFSNHETSVMLEKIIKDARKVNQSLVISCDPGYAWLNNLNIHVEGILRLSDIIFLNEMEFNLLSGERPDLSDLEKAKSVFLKYGRAETKLIVKNETDIKLYSHQDKAATAIGEQTFRIDVISREKISDATAAGDVFAAGFLAALLLNGMDMQPAVELGIKLMRAKLEMAPEELSQELNRIFMEWRSCSN